MQFHPRTIFFILITLISLAISRIASAQTSEFNDGEYQGIIAVIGDPHADFEAFLKVAVGLGIVDPVTHQWIGGSTRLVIMGDLLDRGPRSRKLMDFVMGLEFQAHLNGGKVFTLLGNHELMAVQGIGEEFLHYSEPSQYRDFKKAGMSGTDAYFAAFQNPDSTYAKWLLRRPTIVKLGKYLFVHAGLPAQSQNYSLEWINRSMSEWISFFQGASMERPGIETEWLLGNDGPLEYRNWATELKPPKNRPPRPFQDAHTFANILNHFSASHAIIGHSGITNIAQTINHPYYGQHLIMTDTGINSVDHGELTGFILTENQISVLRFNRQTGSMTESHFTERKAKFQQGTTCKSASN